MTAERDFLDSNNGRSPEPYERFQDDPDFLNEAS